MTFLPNIFKRVDNFVKIAEFYDLISTAAPDDNALYNELVTAASQVVNPEVSYTLQILADMYRKALDINGGFNVLYKTISGIIEDLDPEEEESEAVEDLLNQIGTSIRVRARQTDTPQAMRELQNAASEAKRRLAEQAPDVPEEEDREDQTSAYEAALLGDYETPEKMFEGEGGVAKFDPTGGVKPEEGAVGKGRGYSVGKARTFKDWSEIYAREKERYNQDLNGADNTVTRAVRVARTNDNVRANLESLITVLDQLETFTREALKIEHQILLETEIPHPKEEKRLADIRTELRGLEHQRVLLKRRLNAFYKEAELNNLRKQETATTDLRQKRILQQKVKLQELRLSGSKGYGKESAERQKLIDSLTADPNLSDEEVRKQEANIDQAANFTGKMTRAMFDRKLTEKKMQEAGRGIVPAREQTGGRGGGQAPGWKTLYQIDYDKATYPTLLKRFRDLNNTITSDAKKYVIRPNEKGDPALAPYVEALSAAIKSKNNAAKFTAINNLKQAIKQTLVAAPSLRGYLWAIRLAPHFKAIEEFLYNIKDKQDANGVWNLNEAERATLRTAVEQLTRMSNIYTKYFPKKAGRYGRSHYMTSVDFYPKLIDYIQKNILQEEPMEKQAAESPEKKQLRKERDRIRTIERSKEQGKNIMVGRETGQRGGHSEYEKMRNFDPSRASLSGMISLFQESINTAFTTIKQNLTLAKTGGDPALSPLLKELSTAIVKKDNAGKYNAISAIKSYIDERLAYKQDSYTRLVKLARLMPHLRGLKDDMKPVLDWQNESGTFNLTPNRKLYIAKLVNKAERLEQIYHEYYSQGGKVDISLTAPMKLLGQLNARLKDIYNTGAYNV